MWFRVSWVRAHYPPHTVAEGRSVRSGPCLTSTLGCSQVVRHGTLTPAFAGSSPAIPATSAQAAYRSLTSLPLLPPGRLRDGGPGLFEAQSPVPHTSWICLARVRNQIKFDPVAQLVEQRPFKAKVRGSSPRWVTKKKDTSKTCPSFWVPTGFARLQSSFL